MQILEGNFILSPRVGEYGVSGNDVLFEASQLDAFGM
jgi:hypothetical protein